MQIQTGTIEVTNGSNSVVFSITDPDNADMLLLAVGQLLIVTGTTVPYVINTVISPADSVSGAWEVTLSTNYAGETDAAATYSIVVDYTPYYDLPLLNRGDLSAHTLITRAFMRLDAIIHEIEAGSPVDEPVVADRRATLTFVSDAGVIGSNQTAVAALINTFDPDWALFGGDNTYGASFTADWAAFSAVNAITLPAIGNHDWDRAGILTEIATMFPTLPGNKRYYNKVICNGLVELFVLSSGYNTAGTLLEADGNSVGSTQHTWFVQAVSDSVAKWKIVMFHHPHVTSDSVASRAKAALDWDFQSHGIDLILTGHTHMWEMLTNNGVPILCGGGSVDPSSTSALVLQGITPPEASLEWVREATPGVARLCITERTFLVEIWDTNNTLIKSFDIGQHQSSSQSLTWEVLPYGYESSEILDPNAIMCGHIPHHFEVIKGAQVTFGDALTAATTLTLYSRANGSDTLTEIATYELSAATRSHFVPLSAFTSTALRAGMTLHASLTELAYSAYPVNGMTLSLIGKSLE